MKPICFLKLQKPMNMDIASKGTVFESLETKFESLLRRGAAPRSTLHQSVTGVIEEAGKPIVK
jgi:hypothetical protein